MSRRQHGHQQFRSGTGTFERECRADALAESGTRSGPDTDARADAASHGDAVAANDVNTAAHANANRYAETEA